MQEIKCPNCGQVFQVDESGYAQIVQQVRDREFEKELKRREQELEQKKENDLTIARYEQEKKHNEEVAEKKSELAEKNREIDKLNALLVNADTEKKLAVNEAVREKEKTLSEMVTEITSLKGQLESKEKENQLKEKTLKESYEEKLKDKEELIEYYKNFKARQSTKMVGESLEQHCQNQFNQIRMAAFPNAYFEKDNDAKTGSKGDFIYRESDDGTEFISIMFEMKNQMDTTATKHKNADFFKELDKDRREKKCEYAVLVSLLEIDNDFYNNGIVDVSYEYEKMYVIRPQFFIPIITLLRNAALNSLKYQKELQMVRSQQVDLMNFEDNLKAFQKDIGLNYDRASEKFKKAIKDIDDTIRLLERIKEELSGSENNLRILNSKTEEMTIRKLTKNAPSVKAMLDDIRESKE